ncbi:MAG TPA: GNAT family N-acetyltransferase [Acidimicrobiia bacterium]|jgi:predicted GNAT family N-acyltransferase|nr:GNAT family N-acetyltransferase [Acidimicrobiia bacterium]
MAYEVGLAESDADKEAVYRFRYSVYVEEMGRYQGSADHEGRRLVEPDDDQSFIFYARDGGEVVGTARLSWGGNGFSARQVEEYSLAPFLAELPHEHIAIGERVMVTPDLRGTGLVDQLMERRNQTALEHDVRIQFSACEPHLLSLYLGQGRRTYAAKNINTPEAGYLIPLVAFPEGPDSLRGVGVDVGPEEIPACVEQILTGGGGAVMSPLMTDADDYALHLLAAMHEIEAQDISAFHAFTDDEVERCLARSNVIECAAGDRVLKQGGVARNIFVVLDGTLEARAGNQVVGVIGTGEVFGEMAFLLERPRSVDVYAASGSVRVLSLSESTLRKMVAEDPAVAAKLLFNISKMLCVRIVKADRSTSTA